MPAESPDVDAGGCTRAQRLLAGGTFVRINKVAREGVQLLRPTDLCPDQVRAMTTVVGVSFAGFVFGAHSMVQGATTMTHEPYLVVQQRHEDDVEVLVQVPDLVDVFVLHALAREELTQELLSLLEVSPSDARISNCRCIRKGGR